jgi:arylsulfatase A-like enzyme
VAKGALEFLDNLERTDKPFFLYLAPTAIHGPNHRDDLDRDVTYTPGGRDESVLQYRMDVNSLIEEIEEGDGIDKHRYAGIAQTDYLVGQVRAKLKEIGRAENTAIIFMADHNIEPGKATSFEKGVHVPLVVYWPGMATGKDCMALVQNIDLYPTILEAAGIGLPEEYPLDGISMLPVLQDPEQTIRQWVFTENGYTRSVTDGKYKYIALRYPLSLVEKMMNGAMDHVPSYVRAWPQAHSAIAMQFFPAYFDQEQLYDLEADPYEQNNIYREMADSEVVKEMKKALADHLATFRHPFQLEPDPFMESAGYQVLTEKNLAFDIYTIPWLSRDHGEMVWPPEEE